MNSGPGNARNCILESPILKISLVIMLPDPARSSCINVRAWDTNGAGSPAESLNPVLPNATENPLFW